LENEIVEEKDFEGRKQSLTEKGKWLQGREWRQLLGGKAGLAFNRSQGIEAGGNRGGAFRCRNRSWKVLCGISTL